MAHNKYVEMRTIAALATVLALFACGSKESEIESLFKQGNMDLHAVAQRSGRSTHTQESGRPQRSERLY